MDALPVQEQTGLPYASTASGIDPEGKAVPVMHACGHDAHTAALMGTARLLAQARALWRGTLMIVAQPSEEVPSGARAMLADGLYERFGRPDVALGQHIGPFPAGAIAHRSGPIMAGTEVVTVRLFGKGGHGSRPQTTVDPVVLAAHVVTRLQTIVSREVDPTQAVVVTVGVLRAGTKANVISDQAYLEISTRTFDSRIQTGVRQAIERIARAED